MPYPVYFRYTFNFIFFYCHLIAHLEPIFFFHYLIMYSLIKLIDFTLNLVIVNWISKIFSNTFTFFSKWNNSFYWLLVAKYNNSPRWFIRPLSRYHSFYWPMINFYLITLLILKLKSKPTFIKNFASFKP